MIEQETMLGVLRVLASVGGYPCRENVIYGQFNSAQPNVQTMATLREHLEHAKSKDWVDYLVDEIDHAKKWYITPAGKVILAGH